MSMSGGAQGPVPAAERNDGGYPVDPQVMARLRGEPDNFMGTLIEMFLADMPVRMAAMAANRPISSQLGSTAVRRMSAPSKNSSERASERPRASRTESDGGDVLRHEPQRLRQADHAELSSKRNTRKTSATPQA